MTYTIYPLGDSALIVDFHNSDEEKLSNILTSLTHALILPMHDSFIEAVPSYNTVTVHYNPLKIKSDFPYKVMENTMIEIIETMEITNKRKKTETVTIPVLYGNEYGPDLPVVAQHNDMSIEQVIEIHTRELYTVAFLGFSPGFPFLRGMSPAISTPRRQSPRIKIEAGSVGIAGSQTGVYPVSSPGGWQIIGRTPVKMFDPDDQENPALLSQGDLLKFTPITKAEFDRMEEG
ncbi:5-oxoprolinase subunit PxpB [Bacillus sp. P14.5]|uniref:5-oxoprolinase subunit PxpB n=1 Tax=Bacillus sp. P14.5 TaxID=1983400 RepID=UPI000DEBF594|nr:5-oxoprolinase subunit PxpB [Bacillus sp. P14.5]